MGQEGEKLKLMVNQLQKENEDLRRKLLETGDLNRKISEYENRIALLSQEIERLNSLTRGKSDDANKYEMSLKNLQFEFDNYKKQVRDNEANVNSRYEL